MEIGIFTKVFERPNLTATLDAVAAAGLRAVQFNMDCAGLPEMPDSIEAELSATIRREFEARQLVMSAVSGTFNIIHPDHAQRALGMRRLRVLAAACPALGTAMITLSTGTRNRENMWRNHPDNSTPEAWQEMVESMGEIAAIGAEYGIIMALEPEVNNVVDSAHKARQLLDTLNSPFVKIVMDGANIFHDGELPQMNSILDDACALLGKDIVLAHAKDLDHDGDAGHLAAGYGMLDYGHYLRALDRAGYTGPLILHGLSEYQVSTCVDFLQRNGAQLPNR